MYFDSKPCQVCGAQVRLAPHDEATVRSGRTEPDSTVDERICTNPDCATHRSDRDPDAPRP